MCFYYSITNKPATALVKEKIVKATQLDAFQERYIVSGFDHPLMPVITDALPDGIQYFQWGFLPGNVGSTQGAALFWEKYNTLNAKAGELENSRLYAESFLNRRCLVPCTGFFEWRQVKKEKIPYYITLRDDEIFMFAGIWNSAVDNAGRPMNSYAILTVEANEMMAEIHNTKKRMPLILAPEEARLWLSASTPVGKLKEIMCPLGSDKMKAHTIKKFVPSNAGNLNTPEIIAYYNYPGVPEILKKDNTMLF